MRVCTVQVLLSLAYSTMVSGHFSKSPQGALPGLIGNNRSKGKMRVSEHRSYVTVDKDKNKNAFWGEENEEDKIWKETV